MAVGAREEGVKDRRAGRVAATDGHSTEGQAGCTDSGELITRCTEYDCLGTGKSRGLGGTPVKSREIISAAVPYPCLHPDTTKEGSYISYVKF